MKIRFRTTTPSDETAIVELLKSAGLGVDARAGRLEWKYWTERADWPGSRSYVLGDGRELYAHAAVVPGAILWGGARARVIHMIDWAAAPARIGAGLTLMRRIGGLADALIGVGGSQATRGMLPLAGFRACGSATVYLRMLRPLHGLSDRQDWSWRTLPRLARDLWWALTAPAVRRGPWRALHVRVEDLPSIEAVLPKPRASMAVFERSVAGLAHFLRCPFVPFFAYALEQGGVRKGYFLLAQVGAQARIADCWVDSEQREDWLALVHCIVESARALPGVGEIVAVASDPLLDGALQATGFHARRTDTVLIRLRPDFPLDPPALRFQPIDSDAAYLP